MPSAALLQHLLVAAVAEAALKFPYYNAVAASAVAEAEMRRFRSRWSSKGRGAESDRK